MKFYPSLKSFLNLTVVFMGLTFPPYFSGINGSKVEVLFKKSASDLFYQSPNSSLEPERKTCSLLECITLKFILNASHSSKI